jgi:hypothetical protein
MVLKKWRQRRASIRELKANSDELYKEYLKLCAQDKQLRANQPPAYQDVLGRSRESISTSDSRSRRSTLMGSLNGGSRPATLMEEREERANGDGR